MGRCNKNQRKNAMMLDSDDDVSSSWTLKSDQVAVTGGNEEVEFEKDTLLDESLEALYEKRGSTREKALALINEAFSSSMQHEFVENNCATLLHQCLVCIKKGPSREIYLAARAIGLLSLTVGCGDRAREILEESITPISRALESGSDSLKLSSLLECLSILTFVGGTDPEETEKAMQVMWRLVHPKLGSNVVGIKYSAAAIASMVSSWAFLLTSMGGWKLNLKQWQEYISYFSSLLDKDDRSVRIAAGEALAIIFEIAKFEKLNADAKGDGESSGKGDNGRQGLAHIQGLRAKILNQVRDLAIEAGGKGSAKKDLNSQRNSFKDVLDFLEFGHSPETSMKIGGDSLQTSTWSELIQLNFLKRFLGGGFIKHVQENELLHDVFGFVPNKKMASGNELSSADKRMFRSPNSFLNKARTQFLNKQRMQSRGRNAGHYAVNAGYE